jgi:hypothetical protein
VPGQTNKLPQCSPHTSDRQTPNRILEKKKKIGRKGKVKVVGKQVETKKRRKRVRKRRAKKKGKEKEKRRKRERKDKEKRSKKERK